ncbi:MAG: response regulator [Ignavibacteriales bacterium]|nr:response regulator [Ignavibacteriales bacterium]
MGSVRPVDILLVEDNPLDIGLIRKALKQKNLANSLVVLRDGAEALEFLFARGNYTGRKGFPPPKVVLLDLDLPTVSGLEVLRTIRGDPATRTVPVVVLASSRQEQDIVESYRLGVNSYIIKPVDFEKFAEAVSQIGFSWVLLNKPPAH